MEAWGRQGPNNRFFRAWLFVTSLREERTRPSLGLRHPPFNIELFYVNNKYYE